MKANALNRRVWIGPMETVFLLLGVFAIALIVFIFSNNQSQIEQRQLKKQINEINLAVARAHTAMQRRLSGATSVDATIDVFNPIDEANTACKRLINEYSGVIKKDKNLVGGVDALCDKATVLSQSVHDRLQEKIELAASGQETGEDNLFEGFGAAADEVDALIAQGIDLSQQKTNSSLWLMLAVLVPGFAAVPFVVARSRTTLAATSAVVEEGLARHLAVLDDGLDAIVTIDENGIIETVNAVTERLFGYDSGEMLGQNVSMLMPPLHRSKHDKYIRDYIASGVSEVIGRRRELNAQKKNGQVFLMEIGISPVLLGESLLFTAIIRDISARKTGDESVSNSQKNLMQAFGQLPGGLLRFYLDKDLSVEFANKGACDITGYKPADFASKKLGLVGLLDSKSRESLAEALKLAARDEKAFQCICGLRTAQGQLRQVILQGAINTTAKTVLATAYMSEWTAPVFEQTAKGAPAAPPKAEALEQFSEHLPEPIVTVTTDGQVIALNGAAQHLLFYKSSQLEKKNIRLVLPAWKQLLEQMDTGNTAAGIVIPFTKTQAADGRGKIVNVDVAVSRVVTGQRSNYCVSFRTVSDAPAVVPPPTNQEAVLHALKQADQACFVTDRDGQVVFVNKAFEELYGYTQDELYGSNISHIKSKVHDDAFFKNMWSTLVLGEPFDGLVTNRTKTGQEIERRLRIVPVRDAQFRISHFTAIIFEPVQKQPPEVVAPQVAVAVEPEPDWREQLPFFAIELTLPDMHIRHINRAAEMHLGCARQSVSDHTLSDIFPDNEAALLNRAAIAALKAGGEFYASARVSDPGEEGQHMHVHALPRTDKKGVRHIALFAWLAADETPAMSAAVPPAASETATGTNQALEAKLYDEVTGLPDQALFEDRMQQCLMRVGRTGKKVALLYFDLDQFDTVNRSLGRKAGDELLRQVAERTLKHLRGDSTLARIQDDEFAVIIGDLPDAQHAARIAQRLLNQLKKPFTVSEHEITISAGMGIAMYPDDGTQGGGLLLLAQQAVMLAKKAGGYRFRFASEEKTEAVYEWLEVEKQLRTAVSKQELELEFSPQLDLQSGRNVSMEAILRWKNPQLGEVSRASFIPVAESSGMMQILDEWVLRTVCRSVKQLRLEKGGYLKWCVGVSRIHLDDDEPFKRWLQILKEAHLEPELIEVEVNSRVLEHAKAASILRDFRRQGLQIVLGDFGVNKPELANLANWPVDKVKLSGELVRTLEQAETASIIGSVIAAAHQLNMKVVADGVADPKYISLLRRMQCDIAQGIAVSPPLTEKELPRYLNLDQQIEAG